MGHLFGIGGPTLGFNDNSLGTGGMAKKGKVCDNRGPGENYRTVWQKRLKFLYPIHGHSFVFLGVVL